MLAAEQMGHIVRNAARAIRKYQEQLPEYSDTMLNLSNVVEELEIVGALASKLSITIKTHPKETVEHKKIRNDEMDQLSKASTNAGSTVRDYLLAVADAEKAKQ